MEDWQKRVVQEMQELDNKRMKIHTFISTPAFLELSEIENELLFKQAVLMDLYSEILQRRINTFGKDK